MRTSILKLERYIAEMSESRSGPKDPTGFEACCHDLERYIAKSAIHARTSEGSQSYKWMLRDKYGCSDEDIAKFMDTLFWEQGIDNSQRNGIRTAQNDDAFRNQWHTGKIAPEKNL
jgi:hypothetical protein